MLSMSMLMLMACCRCRCWCWWHAVWSSCRLVRCGRTFARRTSPCGFGHVLRRRFWCMVRSGLGERVEKWFCLFQPPPAPPAHALWSNDSLLENFRARVERREHAEARLAPYLLVGVWPKVAGRTRFNGIFRGRRSCELCFVWKARFGVLLCV